MCKDSNDTVARETYLSTLVARRRASKKAGGDLLDLRRESKDVNQESIFKELKNYRNATVLDLALEYQQWEAVRLIVNRNIKESTVADAYLPIAVENRDFLGVTSVPLPWIKEIHN